MSLTTTLRQAGGVLAVLFLFGPCAEAQQPKTKDAVRKGGGPHPWS
jgi:hypothetical protein